MTTGHTDPSEGRRLSAENERLRAEIFRLNARVAEIEEERDLATEGAEQAQEQCEVLENFCFGLEKEYEQSAVTREAYLALEQDIAKLQEQQDLLENVCFAVEQEHEKARAVLEGTQRELAANFQELRAVKMQQDDILANIAQGILIIDRDGRIAPEHSRRAGEILGRGLAGQQFSALFADDEGRKAKIERFMQLLVDNPWVNDSMVAKLNPLAELRYAPDTGARPRVLAFHFIRIREPSTSRGARVEKIMVVFDDRTIEHELGEALERQLEAYTTKIERIYRILTLPRAEFEQFIHDAREALSEISALFGQQTTAQPDAEALLRIQRASHTLKGHARAFGMEALTDLIHELEERLEAPHGSPCAHRRHEILEVLASIRAEIDDGQAILARFADMGGAVARQRRKPTDEIEFALRKLVTDTASRLGKTVDLYYHRDVPAVPAMVLRVMKTVLIHVVGNAVVHGIEYSSERARRSKPGEGRIEVEISPAASGVSILCRDDGRGLDINAIRQVAVERGVVEPSTAQTMTSEEVHRLIFVPGVSTASTTTTAAGRGIGMDAVSDAVHSLGGRIKVQSEPGKFTEFHVFIPNVRTPAVEETHEDLGR